MTDPQYPQPAPPNGGPAFPMPSYLAEVGATALEAVGASEQIAEQFTETACGMSLRDYFAAKALPNIYSTAMVEASDGSGLFSDPDWRIGLAMDAYAMADAMLKARTA